MSVSSFIGRDRPRETRLLLFDGNNLLVRALHGMASATLTGPDGTPTGGLLGAIRALGTYQRQYRPTHMLWAFDQGRSSFRTEIRPEYKANRDPKPDENTTETFTGVAANSKGIHARGLDPEHKEKTFTEFRRFLDLNGIRHHSEPGIEADDHIAAAVRRWKGEMPIVIISADHDLRQLCDREGTVTVVKPATGTTTREAEKVYDWGVVTSQYGVTPERLAELWAIQGDSGDGVEGLKGFGPVKSAKLLKEHGTLLKLLQSGHPKVAGKELWLFDNFRLIDLLIDSHSQIPFGLEDCAFDPNGYDYTGLLRFFAEWGFDSQIKRLQDTDYDGQPMGYWH